MSLSLPWLDPLFCVTSNIFLKRMSDIGSGFLSLFYSKWIYGFPVWEPFASDPWIRAHCLDYGKGMLCLWLDSGASYLEGMLGLGKGLLLILWPAISVPVFDSAYRMEGVKIAEPALDFVDRWHMTWKQCIVIIMDIQARLRWKSPLFCHYHHDIFRFSC